MSGRRFFDTNVLLYSLDFREPQKQSTASTLVASALAEGSGVISSQVVVEFAYNLLRKLHLTPLKVSEHCESLQELEVVHNTLDVVELALHLVAYEPLSFWDACIVSAAAHAGCETLVTEDLNHGQTFAGVKIINPFL
jgi:predicted nucleic acid-binding protein